MIKKVKIQTAELFAHCGSCFLSLPVVVSFAVLLPLLFLLPSLASSEIYKWKDSNGNVVYSDSPQSGSNAEEVRPKKDSRFERPPSKEVNEPKTVKKNKTETGPKLRDTRDINVVLYMTDW